MRLNQGFRIVLSFSLKVYNCSLSCYFMQMVPVDFYITVNICNFMTVSAVSCQDDSFHASLHNIDIEECFIIRV